MYLLINVVSLKVAFFGLCTGNPLIGLTLEIQETNTPNFTFQLIFAAHFPTDVSVLILVYCMSCGTRSYCTIP
jgi:hypothetical protein